MNKDRKKGTSLVERWRNDDDPVKILEEPEKNKQRAVAKTFDEVLKANPYHDENGRFTSANGGGAAGSAGGAGSNTETGAATAGAGAISDTEWMTWAFDAEPIKEFVQDGVITTQYDSTGHKITDEEREEFQVIGAKIQEAAQNGRIPDRILYRGESFDTIDEFKEKYKYNKKIETATITSTSPDIEVARAYADGVEAPVQVVVRFNNVNGHKGVHTEPMGVPTNEIVLPKGELYRVSRIIDEGNNRFTVDLYSKEKHSKIKKTDDTQQFHIMKTDDDKRLIFGWASVAIKVDGEQVVDHQKDLIDPEDLEEAVYEYVLNFRDAGEEHISTLRKKGRLVESCMFTKEKMQAMGIPEGIVPEGWWIGFYVDDDAAWEKVKSGIYQMFSIEGKGIREEIEEDEEVKKNDDITKFNPYHGKDGRFTSKNGGGAGATASGRPCDKMTDKEIEQKYGKYRYHATTEGAIASISSEGLKPNRGHMGDGVYFAPSAEDAQDWTDTSTGGKTVLRVKTVRLMRDYEYGDIDETEGSTESPNPIKSSLIEIKAPSAEHWVPINQYVQQGGYNFNSKIYNMEDGYNKAGAMGKELNNLHGSRRKNAIKEFASYASDQGWEDWEIEEYI